MIVSDKDIKEILEKLDAIYNALDKAGVINKTPPANVSNISERARKRGTQLGIQKNKGK